MKAPRFLIASLLCLTAVGALAADDQQKKEEEQAEIRQMQTQKRMGRPGGSINAHFGKQVRV